MVVCHQNQRRQNLYAPLLPSGQYCGHCVVQYLPDVQQHLPIFQSGSTCRGIHSEKRNCRKSQLLFTAQLLRKTNLAEISASPDLERSLTTKTKKELRQSPTKAVVSLARTQIHNFTNNCFPSLRMFCTFNTVYVYLLCSKSSFIGEYTNTHYKMTRILFVYL